MTEETTNTIAFTAVNSTTGEIVRLEKPFADGCTWNEISEMYFRFLTAMGYHLDSDDVGADFSTN